MRRLGTLDPETEWVDQSGAFWYLVGYFGFEELPDSFFEKYTRQRLSRKEMKKRGQEVREKIKLLKDEYPETPKYANTR